MRNEILYTIQNDSPIMHFYPIFLMLKWSYFLKCPFSINCYTDVFFFILEMLINLDQNLN